MKHILVLLLAIGCSGQGSQDRDVSAKTAANELNVAKATPEERAAIARYKEKKRIEEERAIIEKAKGKPKARTEKEVIADELRKGCNATKARFEKIGISSKHWYIGLVGGTMYLVDDVFPQDKNKVKRALENIGAGDPVPYADFARYMGACD